MLKQSAGHSWYFYTLTKHICWPKLGHRIAVLHVPPTRVHSSLLPFQGYSGPRLHWSNLDANHASGDSSARPVGGFVECQVCRSGCLSVCPGPAPACLGPTGLHMLRAIPLAVQNFCITICLLTGTVIFRMRRTRVSGVPHLLVRVYEARN
ncbi:unnamed protein product [Protopolystoma xenopodis]|uniref:Uncharacterized protein n=1 Tax=Protopolystoma xenopodis TaxID=117903 RepID=A0A3S5CQ21_9PLAT|nr:unnamed protein product [Protopolystoma xenopodis]